MTTVFQLQEANLLKESGNVAFKTGDWESACKQYQSAIASFKMEEEHSSNNNVDPRMIHTITACYSNLCVALYKQGKWHEVSAAATDGLSVARRSTAVSTDPATSVTSLVAKLKARTFDAALSLSIIAAATETNSISRSNPVHFHSKDLRAALADTRQTKYFFTGQFTSHLADALQAPRLLVTLSVFTCITVWAWHRQEQQGKVTFRALGAHIPIGALLHGVRSSANSPSASTTAQEGVQLLPELERVLQQCFSEVNDKSEVKISFVGGQQAQDLDPGLQHQYSERSENHKRFGWHVEQSIRQAGFSNIVTTLLNVFPGSILPMQP